MKVNQKIGYLKNKVIEIRTFAELDLGPNREAVECEGDIPKQQNDPNSDCFDIGRNFY